MQYPTAGASAYLCATYSSFPPPNDVFLLTKAKANKWFDKSLSARAACPSGRVTGVPSASKAHTSQAAGPLQPVTILFPLPFLQQVVIAKNYGWWHVTGLHHILTLAFSYCFSFFLSFYYYFFLIAASVSSQIPACHHNQTDLNVSELWKGTSSPFQHFVMAPA